MRHKEWLPEPLESDRHPYVLRRDQAASLERAWVQRERPPRDTSGGASSAARGGASAAQSPEGFEYIPQAGDEVVYFMEGHRAYTLAYPDAFVSRERRPPWQLPRAAVAQFGGADGVPPPFLVCRVAAVGYEVGRAQGGE